MRIGAVENNYNSICTISEYNMGLCVKHLTPSGTEKTILLENHTHTIYQKLYVLFSVCR